MENKTKIHSLNEVEMKWDNYIILIFVLILTGFIDLITYIVDIVINVVNIILIEGLSLNYYYQFDSWMKIVNKIMNEIKTNDDLINFQSLL